MTKWTDYNQSFDPSWDFGHNPVLEGVLVAKKEHVGLNDSFVFTFESSKDNKKYAVWGSKVLDKINEIPVGTLMRIEYTGDVKGKGPKPYHNYKIQLDEDTRPVTADEAKDVFGV